MPIYTDKETGRLFIKFSFKGQNYKQRLPEETSKKDAAALETK